MRFGILGTTRVWRADGREVVVGGPALRRLLALLLVRSGEAATVDSLVEELYGERPVLDAGHALQAQISRLRRTLGEVTIDSLPSGYRLPTGGHQIDATEFERLSEEGRQALGAGEPRRAAELLRAALALWRGAVLAEVADAHSAQALIMRLEERRLAGVEDRIEAEIRLGEHRSVVAELRELVTRHPLRERPHGLLMRALVGSGETAEALATFAAFRQRLVEELGTEPSATSTPSAPSRWTAGHAAVSPCSATPDTVRRRCRARARAWPSSGPTSSPGNSPRPAPTTRQPSPGTKAPCGPMWRAARSSPARTP